MTESVHQYCSDVAELYLGLKEAVRHRSEKDSATHDRSTPNKVLRKRRGMFDNLTPEAIEVRERWFEDATAVLNRPRPGQVGTAKQPPDRSSAHHTSPEEMKGFWPFLRKDDDRELDDLAQLLRQDLALLNDLLHALDRGDETYFLYLTRKVGEINTWLNQNHLYWSKLKVSGASEAAPIQEDSLTPDAVEDKQKRISEAWPWAKERATRTALWRQSRAALKETSPTFPSLSGDAFEGDVARRMHEDRIAAYLEFCRQYEFQMKIEAWQDAPAETSHEREKAGQKKKSRGPFSSEVTPEGETLENLVLRVFEYQSEAEHMFKLANLLFRSPHEQSKLALLLGLPPSRWLREEEKAGILDRRRIHDANSSDAQLREVTGLCFSGGGIRSATFNLGILQALAELHLLEAFDYLSTVSGGGYIHQWIAAWLKRASESAGTPEEPSPLDAFKTVNKALIAQPASVLPGIEPTQISFLRRFSNYLTPQLGAFSGDTWTLVAIWTRNTFLNQLIVVSGFLAAFAALRCGLLALEKWTSIFGPGAAAISLELTAFVGFSLFLIFVLWRLKSFSIEVDRAVESNRSTRQDRWIATAILLLLLSALFYTAICAADGLRIPVSPETFGSWFWLLLEAPTVWLLAALLLWPIAMASAAFTPRRYKRAHPRSSLWGVSVTGFLSAVFASATVFLLLASAFYYLCHALPHLWYNHICPSKNPLVQHLVSYISNHPSIWCDLIFLFVPPVLVVAFFLASVLHIGLNRAVFQDEVLEWMARLRAWSFLISFSWIGLGGCLVLSAPLLSLVTGVKAKAWSSLATLLWAAISGGGAAAAKGEGKAGDSAIKQFGRQALVLLAPYVFILGTFVGVSSIVWLVCEAAGDAVNMQLIYAGGLCASATVFFVLYGLNVDINEFSMYSFYRNRLARCYQGASVVERRPDGFTGFSSDDRSIRLGDLRYRAHDLHRQAAAMSGEPALKDARQRQYPGPFPIFSCTLNFTSGEDLAWQERKGASFAFTPLYSGYDIPWTGIDRKSDQSLYYNGFRDTLDLANPNGPGLADVCAISGAAASPNSGYHTSPGTAFLMTCFNVRLGIWNRNTRYPPRSAEDRKFADPGIETQSPRFAPWHLLLELFGKTNAKNEFLYLSDGGHFDNMGLYELVRRECRYIVICDAEQDGELAFGGIAMALRKCRTDFGVEIDLDLRAIRKSVDTGLSSVHCVVGTILYPNEDPETPGRDRGKIVYLKSTLTGGEPADILAYKLDHQAFPHDTTANQWFSESQFESYRVLGRFIGLNSLKPAFQKEDNGVGISGKQREFFNRLYDIWYPVTPTIERHLTKHGEEFDELLRELRSKDDYAVHANEIFEAGRVRLSRRSKKEDEYLKAFAHSLFEFMWRVFNDLHLQIASNRAHPQGQVWINTFRRWAEMLFVQQAWPHYRDRYPASFHFFLREHLEVKDATTEDHIDTSPQSSKQAPGSPPAP